MKGETINFRKKDNSWVSGFFLPEAITEVSVNSRKYYNYCRNDSSSVYGFHVIVVRTLWRGIPAPSKISIMCDIATTTGLHRCLRLRGWKVDTTRSKMRKLIGSTL